MHSKVYKHPDVSTQYNQTSLDLYVFMFDIKKARQEVSMKKLNAKKLRVSRPTKKELNAMKRTPICFVLDRIIDTYNVGSLFRLADAVAARKVYLCGNMEYPPNSRIHKAAVGTENWVPWEKTDSTLKTVKKLRKNGIFTIAIEQDNKSVPYTEVAITHKKPIAIIVGNESRGIEKKVLDEVDVIVELPMYGINISFNTWGCAAIVAYKILEEMIN